MDLCIWARFDRGASFSETWELKPVMAGDAMPTGALVQTGPVSWGEVKWSGAIIRVWQNGLLLVDPDHHSIKLAQGGITFSLGPKNTEVYELRTRRKTWLVHGEGTAHLIDQGNVESLRALRGNVIEVPNSQTVP